ncbi:MAG TPA: glycosyltransferase [Candidatus Omnitrophota bacterium]|nr:glycosyltransferase [Candidatus Omnitrophota bacterium]
MRVLIVDTYYSAFLESFYRRNPEIGRLDYSGHLARMMRERFSTFDSYSFYFRQSGWEAEDVIVNDGCLQAKWARENGIFVPPIPGVFSNASNVLLGKDWRFKVLLGQAKKMRPDVILIQEQSILTDAMVRELKRHARLLVSQIASPLLKRRRYDSVDLVVTSFPHYVSLFREKGLKAEYVALAFDKRILDEIGEVSEQYPISFVGGVSPVHRHRLAVLERLSGEMPLDWFGYGAKKLPAESPLKKTWRGEVWGLDMYRALASSRNTVNCHEPLVQGDYANNNRLFEATGVGTCLVTDWKQNIRGFFEPDREVVIYNNPEELIEKVRYLLAHPEEALTIGAAGQKRTLRDHTCEKRVLKMADLFKKFL